MIDQMEESLERMENHIKTMTRLKKAAKKLINVPEIIKNHLIKHPYSAVTPNAKYISQTYDVVVPEYNQETQVIGVSLVAEIANNYGSIDYLVEKLTRLFVTNSDNKVLIFSQKHIEQFDKSMHHIAAALHAYRHKTHSKILIACWIESEQNFVFKRYAVERCEHFSVKML